MALLMFSAVLIGAFSTLPCPALSLYRFSPPDYFLVNCGSPSDSLDQANRLFLGDDKSSSPRFFHLVDQNPVPGAPGIYRTAAAFSKPYKYVFPVRERGTHALRLHFNRFRSSAFDRYDVEFHVLVGGFVVLSNFTGGHGATVKEFFIWVDKDEVAVHFLPSTRNKIGFVNAIELISSPKDLIPEVAHFVGDGEIVDFEGLNRQALEVVHRLNVGGPKITPFNDSLWRTWAPDDEFFLSSSVSDMVYSPGRIQYREGGASREVGPDNMYSSARVIRSANQSVSNISMTWVLPVVRGHNYLVRLHFCDIASISLGLIYFNVYLNGVLVYENLDLTHIVNEILASPYYVDFIVDGDGLQTLNVSIGPSNYSLPHAVDGILNGIEVMKLNNSMGSLDGEVCAGFLFRSWPRENIGSLVPLIALICLILGISLVKHMRAIWISSTVVWTKLPTDGMEVFEEQAAPQIAGKI
ncbi:hypothetical protein MLD38_010580 [Melastoma candidum]|uniref:Uncharacterized protein n=1 Tax=Melastoma candidum TaxID=119954 RepID=A0ACB9R1D7_9MYRT|nr:hypothetical protein MLD38_010580 [Melastoma candidum]